MQTYADTHTQASTTLKKPGDIKLPDRQQTWQGLPWGLHQGKVQISAVHKHDCQKMLLTNQMEVAQ